LLGGEYGDDGSILDRDALTGGEANMAFGSEGCGELDDRRGESIDDCLVGEVGNPFAKPLDGVRSHMN
tara:strand:+ start:5025 stop:5228 length:204 start_codon:yes stop_codon:yes gene_type:complete